MRDEFEEISAETAHLKAIGMNEGWYAVANLTSRDTPVRLSLASTGQMPQFDLVVNARVAMDPESLQEIVCQTLNELGRPLNASIDIRSIQSFRPGRPVPTHRLNTSV